MQSPGSQSSQKRFLVFTYYPAQPLGGMNDYLDAFGTLDEALDNLLTEHGRYYQIVDRHTMMIVKQGPALFKNFAPDHFRKHDSPDN